MARPTSNEKRSEHVKCRVTKDEKRKIYEMVKNTGSNSVSEFLYDLVFKEGKEFKQLVALPQQQLKNLMNIGSNINQIAKVLNTVSNPHLTTDDKLRLKEMHQDLKKILQAVTFK